MKHLDEVWEEHTQHEEEDEEMKAKMKEAVQGLKSEVRSLKAENNNKRT